MSKFNLLEEPWISVYCEGQGQKLVSMKDVFSHAKDYSCLAGEMKTQDFAILRLLEAVLQTVFSRCDAKGEKYPYLEVDEKMRQIQPVDEDDREDYIDDLEKTWEDLWKAKRFPDILFQYLETWKDRFFLYDNKYPFYQITDEVLEKHKLTKASPSPFRARTMNRTISESNNKISLFSPKDEKSKDELREDQIARWLIMLQGYIGTSDKAKFEETDSSVTLSKGWLFDIGGLYLKGRNLFATLMLNFLPCHSREEYQLSVQKPCWEFTPEENLEALIAQKPVDNLAQLYTNWDRAIQIEQDDNGHFKQLGIVKVPEISHVNQFLEPMTVWQFNMSGPNKDHYTPKKHQPDQAMWRSFGLIAMKSTTNQMQPEILNQYKERTSIIGDATASVCAVGMKDDGNATSWVPVDETTDELDINDMVLRDDESSSGWVVRIDSTVKTTKDVVDKIYRDFLKDIAEIHRSDAPINTESFYAKLNLPFSHWLASIRVNDSKEEKVKEWYAILKKLMLAEAEKIIDKADNRDFVGIEDKGVVKNIATEYQTFCSRLKKLIG